MTLFSLYLVLEAILFIHKTRHKEQYQGRLMIAFLIPLAVAGASAIYQGIKGAKQKREANRAQAEADKLEQANLSEAKRMALSGMPNEEYLKQLQAINRNEAASLGYLRDRRSALAAATTIQQATNDATLALNAQDAQMKRQAQRAALDQANRVASLKGQEAGYMRESGQAMTGAAFQNLFNTAGYGAMALSGNGGDGGGDTSGMAIGATSGMKPLNTSLFGKGGYKGGLGINYSKPY